LSESTVAADESFALEVFALQLGPDGQKLLKSGEVSESYGFLSIDDAPIEAGLAGVKCNGSDAQLHRQTFKSSRKIQSTWLNYAIETGETQYHPV
jgi:hypothetical protein